MKQLVLVFSFFAILNSLSAQVKCDSLVGDWTFVRWQTDQFLIDLEDDAASVKGKFKQYREVNHVTEIPVADSLNIIKEYAEVVKEMKESGFMRISLKKDLGFNWHGSVNDPNVDFSGTYKCDSNVVYLAAHKGDENVSDAVISLTIVSRKGKYLSLKLPEAPTSEITNSIFTFRLK